MRSSPTAARLACPEITPADRLIRLTPTTPPQRRPGRSEGAEATALRALDAHIAQRLG